MSYPKPPSLDRPAGYVWRKTIEQLEGQGTFRESDLALVERYVLSLQTARRLRDEIADRQRREAAGETEKVVDVEVPVRALYSYGSTGQLVAHPAIKMVRDAEADAHRYAEALLLTPAARARARVDDDRDDGDPEVDDILG